MKVKIKYYIKLYSNFQNILFQQRLYATVPAKANAETAIYDEYFSAAGVNGSKHLSGLAGLVQYVV